ncbi:MAG: winged helix-turn-helix domain-containing protein [Methanomassiliicoccales archaeon]|nr:winged helix-turn-helix domain-containing protein [Methanomassiliicoccales archaeon]
MTLSDTMATRPDPLENEVSQIKERMDEMSIELQRITSLLTSINVSNNDRSGLFRILRDEARDKAITQLDAGMPKRCEMRKECRQEFIGFLDENLLLLERPRISDEDVLLQSEKLGRFDGNVIKGRCDGCIGEVGSIFQQQTELMRALGLYRTKEELRNSIDVLPEDRVVKDLLEPISNVQRITVLKSLAKAPCSFSELSVLTNLRGGNLLFHLQRLTASGMIIQNGERGDYGLSDKGMKALELVNELYLWTARSTSSDHQGNGMVK